MTDAWTTLGIEPTSDAAAIRRAYARKLKATRPEDDPEAFQRLLQARETALLEATWLSQPPADDEEDEAEDSQPASDLFVPETLAPEQIPTGRDAVDKVISATEAIVSGEPGPEAENAAAVRIVEIAPIEGSAEHWAEARRLAGDVETLFARSGGVDPSGYRKLLAQAAGLPRGPRHEVEAKLVECLARELRQPDQAIDPRRADRLRPLLALAEPVFDWARDDAVIHSVLEPRDGAAFCLMAREASLAANPERRSAVLHDLPAAIGLLHERDARIFLAGKPNSLRAFEKLRRSGRWSWRLDPWAFALPHLWAIRHRCFGAALLVLGGMWVAAGAAILALDGPPWYAVASACLYAAVHLGAGLSADRVVLRAARHAARAASRRGLYDPSRRDAFLQKRGQPLSGLTIVLLAVFGGSVLWWPYFGLVALAARAFGH